MKEAHDAVQSTVALGPDASDSGLAATAAEEHEETVSLREDNARIVADSAALARDQARADKDRKTDAEALRVAQAQYRAADELEGSASHRDAQAKSPIELMEEKRVERTGRRNGPPDPYREALRRHAEEGPYEAMRLAAMDEYAAFQERRKQFDRKIAAAPTQDARRSVEQLKDIHAADHLAMANYRIADQTQILTGSPNSDEVVEARERGTEHEAEGAKVRRSFRERTGRDPQLEGLSDDAAAREQVAQSYSDERSVGHVTELWNAVGGEITDSKRERLAALDGSSGGDSGKGRDGPARPRTGGRSY